MSSFSLDRMQFNLGSAQVDVLRDALPLHDVRVRLALMLETTSRPTDASQQSSLARVGTNSLTGRRVSPIFSLGRRVTIDSSGGFANDRLFGGDGNDRITVETMTRSGAGPAMTERPTAAQAKIGSLATQGMIA